MKKAFIVIFCAFSFSATASHIVGGEFRMSHLNGFNYKFDLIIYFDDVHGNPGALDNSVIAKIFRNSDNAYVMDVPMPLISRTRVDYLQASCSSGLVQIDELTYTSTLILQPDQFGDSSGYYIVWERCCRNYQITNIYSDDPNSSLSAIVSGQTFILQFPAVFQNDKLFINSSPKFTKPYADYTCVGYPYFSDFSAQDVDDDSLVYSVTTPLSTQTANPLPDLKSKPYPSVQWRPGFSLQHVMGGNSILSIDNKGIVSVTPGLQGLFSFAILCEEFRNGKKIGEARREFQIFAIDCPPQTPPVISGRTLGGTYSTTPLNVHFSQAVGDTSRCIQVKVTDPDASTRSQNIHISALPLDFTGSVLGILPSVTNATLSSTVPFAEFSICFDKCPPTLSNTFRVGIVAFDASCAVPLTDTLIVNVTIDVPAGECQHQVIHFPGVADQDIGQVQFSLSASSSSGLPVTYSSPDSSFVKLSSSTVALLKPGFVRVIAKQMGDKTHLAANPVTRKFCVNPEPPTLSLRADGTSIAIQSSSTSGNLWYKDGAYQRDLTASSVSLTNVTSDHSYTVRTLIDNCISQESSPLSITGIMEGAFQLFPNPVTNNLYINFPQDSASPKTIRISGVMGQTIIEAVTSNENAAIDMTNLSSGIYLITIKDSSQVFVRKIYKK